MLPALCLLVPFAALFPAPQSQASETQIQSAFAALQPSSYTDFSFFQRFDPVRGRLLRVDVEYVTTIERDFGLENTGPISASYDLDQLSTLRATVNGNVPLVISQDGTRNYSGSLPAYDGVTDFAGSSGLTLATETLTQTTLVTSSPAGPPGAVIAPELAPANFGDSPNGGGIFSAVLFADSSLSFLPLPPLPFMLSFEERVESSLSLSYVFEQGEAFCTGDYSAQDPSSLNTCSPCPCGNDAAPGSPSGCLNSVGSSAELIARGRASASSNTLEMRMVGGVPQAMAVLFASSAALPLNPSSPCFGLDSGVTSLALDGLRCLGANPRRLGTRQLDATGSVGFSQPGWGGTGSGGGLVGQGGFFPGQAVCYQVIYRDDPDQSCGTGLATSQGRRVQTYN